MYYYCCVQLCCTIVGVWLRRLPGLPGFGVVAILAGSAIYASVGMRVVMVRVAAGVHTAAISEIVHGEKRPVYCPMIIGGGRGGGGFFLM